MSSNTIRSSRKVVARREASEKRLNKATSKQLSVQISKGIIRVQCAYTMHAVVGHAFELLPLPCNCAFKA